jgi:hypothetical protein
LTEGLQAPGDPAIQSTPAGENRSFDQCGHGSEDQDSLPLPGNEKHAGSMSGEPKIHQRGDRQDQEDNEDVPGL